jgi:NADPH-dependent 2,4-dienoyl-CoA reductase/sulfur reductase-like enzyme/rhodanese-related sulfurtransferase
MTDRKRLLIVGGVAGGASAAARARRLDENCEIVVFDKGPHVSFANCGLPYYVGNVIQDERKLLVATPELFRQRFDIEVRVNSEVTSIDSAARTIEVRDRENDRTYTERYDWLVLSPGARAIRPPLPGIDLPGIFSVRTIPDTRRIRTWLQDRDASKAVVVGGGFIGLEMAENLAHRGLDVRVVELAEHVMPPLDPEMAVPVEEHLRSRGIGLTLGDGIAGFEEGEQTAIGVRTQSGELLPADLVILAIGVRPETTLAQQAGLELGARGGVKVDEHMRSSVDGIWAVGDVVEVRETTTGIEAMLPLAGPANRQGRIAANDIFGRPARFRGVQGTAVCGLFGLTVAMTGCSEKALKRAGIDDFKTIYLHPGHHVSYFPGAKKIHMKLIFRPGDGRILGAQAVGEEGVARRIDVISMAIQKEATVFDLEEAELCYAPQFGAAKDPVNLAGMIAVNVVRGDLPVARWEALERDDVTIVDVRSASEVSRGGIAGALNIPLEELRGRLEDLPRDRDLLLLCQVGQRAYYATRLLLQHGVAAHQLPGGYETFRWFDALNAVAEGHPAADEA